VLFKYLVFFSFIINSTSTELFFNCWKVSISEGLVHAVIGMSFAQAVSCLSRVEMLPSDQVFLNTVSITRLHNV
jgi:hypothetical protein